MVSSLIRCSSQMVDADWFICLFLATSLLPYISNYSMICALVYCCYIVSLLLAAFIRFVDREADSDNRIQCSSKPHKRTNGTEMRGKKLCDKREKKKSQM